MIDFWFVANPNEEELKLWAVSATASCRQRKLKLTLSDFYVSNNPFLECSLKSQKNSLQPTFVANFGFVLLIVHFAFQVRPPA